jgi:predicted nucleic acid-binding protein
MIFVDSSFWIGLSRVRDDRHGDALRLIQAHQRSQLITTNHVCGETWTFLRKRDGHDVAVRFVDGAEGAQRLRIVEATPEVERDAWEWLRRHDERPYSFVDATSFALMRRLGIREAFAFDGDFAAAGFVELRPE